MERVTSCTPTVASPGLKNTQVLVLSSCHVLPWLWWKDWRWIHFLLWGCKMLWTVSLKSSRSYVLSQPPRLSAWYLLAQWSPLRRGFCHLGAVCRYCICLWFHSTYLSFTRTIHLTQSWCRFTLAWVSVNLCTSSVSWIFVELIYIIWILYIHKFWRDLPTWYVGFFFLNYWINSSFLRGEFWYPAYIRTDNWKSEWDCQTEVTISQLRCLSAFYPPGHLHICPAMKPKSKGMDAGAF